MSIDIATLRPKLEAALGERLQPGESLGDRIAEGKLPAAEAARIALECARALAAAHAVGVVHRDIKPANILLDANGNATVTDFGIALVTSRRARALDAHELQ